MKSKAQLQRYMLKKELVAQDILVEKHQYLLVVELLMDQRDQFIKLKKLIKKLENLVCCIC